MAPKFTDDDIRQQLAELGYPNIPEERLRVFVKDLRRLMKYEEKKRQLAAELEEEDLENQSPRQKNSRSVRVINKIFNGRYRYRHTGMIFIGDRYLQYNITVPSTVPGTIYTLYSTRHTLAFSKQEGIRIFF